MRFRKSAFRKKLSSTKKIHTRREGSFFQTVRLLVWASLLTAMLAQGFTEANADDAQTKQARQRFEAHSLYADSLTRKLRVTAGGLALDTGTLIEDDAPASGSTHRPNAYDIATMQTVIRKELLLDSPQAFSARLLFNASSENDDAPPLQIEVNGHSMKFHEGLREEDFYVMEIPLEYLKAGSNTIIFRSSSAGWRFPIALDENFAKGSLTRTRAPGRSAKSTDGGATWSKQLGVKNDITGEYGVRIFLNRYAAEGSCVSAVLDAGTLSAPALLPQPIIADSLSFTAEVDEPPGASLQIFARSGSTAFPQAETWSDWLEFLPSQAASLRLRGRFLQFQLKLKTTNPVVSPRLFALELQSAYRLSPQRGVYVRRSDNQQIVESPVAFDYEAADLPALKRFREQHKLDEVVAGAQTEFERITRLRHWVAQQRNEREMFRTMYPAWDAADILRSTSQGQCLTGHCMQYTLVFMQACRAFGIPCRHFTIDGFRDMGHEIAEVWSRDFRKWIYMDASLDCHYFDKETGTPLNLLELHRVFVETFYREGETLLNTSPAEMNARGRAIGKRVPIDCVEGGFSYGTPKASHAWWWEHGYLAAGFLRMTPRNNFLSALSPLPLNQGNGGRDWDGFISWEDSHTPRLSVHTNHTDKERDFYWTLNQAQMALDYSETSGVLQVELKNSMPFFRKYVARINDGEWQEVTSPLVWKLIVGTNKLEVKPVDRTRGEGIVSWVEVSYQPVSLKQ